MRFALRDFMAAIAIGATVTAWSVRNDPARFPLVAAVAACLFMAYKAVLQQPRAGVRKWAFVSLAATALLVGALLGGPLGLELKEEVRAREALVDSHSYYLGISEGRVEVLTRRIARSQASATRDSRHDRWVEELAEAKSEVGLTRSRLVTFRRLAARPWESFPAALDDRYYLDAPNRDHLNRFMEPWGTVLWSGCGAATVAAVARALLSLPLFVASHIRGRRRDTLLHS